MPIGSAITIFEIGEVMPVSSQSFQSPDSKPSMN